MTSGGKNLSQAPFEKLRRGEWPTKAPLGYIQSNVKGEQIITVNETGKLLKNAFMMKAEQHLSNVEILEWLNKMGLRLTKQRLSEILKNPFYCGVITHAMLGDEIVQGKHEKLVSEKTFLQVNNIQKKNNHGYTHAKYDTRLPLKSHLKCASCGTNMTGYEVKQRKGIPPMLIYIGLAICFLLLVVGIAAHVKYKAGKNIV